jgi:4-alpha-glucanotransferase
MDGRWVPAPTVELLETFARKFPCFQVIAEDLGTITLDVREVMREFGIPGMKVLVLAFEDGPGAERQHPPQRRPGRRPLHRHPRHQHRAGVGRGRGHGRAPREAAPYFGRDIPADDLPRAFIRLAMSTVANTVIVPVQDVLGLGSEARMNRPGVPDGNWTWRLEEGMLTPGVLAELGEMTGTFERDGAGAPAEPA